MTGEPADPTAAVDAAIPIPPNGGEQWIFRAPPMPDLIRIKVSPANGSPTFAMGTQELPPGYVIPVHRHVVADEILYFTYGDIIATLDGRQVPVSAGTTVFVQHGTWHGFTNTSGRPAEMIWFISPPGLEQFFRDCSVAPGQPWSPLPPQVINEIAAKYGTIFQQSGDGDGDVAG
jgi:quercetin dioxygenase-like cupin family protein